MALTSNPQTDNIYPIKSARRKRRGVRTSRDKTRLRNCLSGLENKIFMNMIICFTQFVQMVLKCKPTLIKDLFCKTFDHQILEKQH